MDRESLDNLIMETVTSIDDFDWEVKLEILEFIQSVIIHESKCFRSDGLDCLPSYATGLITKPKGEVSCSDEIKIVEAIYKLHSLRCWKTLFMAVEDYDQTVCRKANQILTSFSKKLKDVVNGDSDEKKLKALCGVMDKQLPKFSQNGTANGCVSLNIENLASVQSIQTVQLDFRKFAGEEGNLNSNNYGYYNQETVFKEELLELIENLLTFKPAENSSVENDYETNPFSLLEDILLCAQKDEDNNIVDCY